MDSFKIVLASGNAGKYREMKDAIEEIGAELLFGGDFDDRPNPEESGATYEENAIIKARAWAMRTGLPAMADDSGLEVAHLDGAPGVRSARAVPGSDRDRYEWLLREMRGVSDRRARFVACIAVVFPDKEEILISEGICCGTVTEEPAGTGGFGYDPIFRPDGFDKTFAEIGKDVKLKISHRASALKGIAEKLKPVLKSFTVHMSRMESP
jgi:XTP/dITP diphosphohydrolase